MMEILQKLEDSQKKNEIEIGRKNVCCRSTRMVYDDLRLCSLGNICNLCGFKNHWLLDSDEITLEGV